MGSAYRGVAVELYRRMELALDALFDDEFGVQKLWISHHVVVVPGHLAIARCCCNSKL
jgi:hypothetical protein